MSVCELIPVPPVPSILTSIFRNWEDVSWKNRKVAKRTAIGRRV